MKEKKRQLNCFTIYDFHAIEEHLSKMAEEGWMIERAEGMIWTYRKIEPAKIHFSVTYFEKSHVLDPEPSEELRAFWEFCEYTGWKLAVSGGPIQIFYNEGENPCPLETDPFVQVQNIHRAARKTVRSNLILGVFLAMVNLLLFFWQLWEHPLDTLLDATRLWSFCLWCVYLICIVREAVWYYNWYRRALNTAIEENRLLMPKRNRLGQILFEGILIIIAICMLSSLPESAALSGMIFGISMMALIFFLVFSLSHTLKRKKVSAKVNIAVTVLVAVIASYILLGGILAMIIRGMESGFFVEKRAAGTYEYDGRVWEYYEDELPLMVSDLTGEDAEGYSCQLSVEKTLFVTITEAVQRPRFDAADYKNLSRLEYKIVQAGIPGMSSILKKAALAEHRDEKHGDYTFTDHYEAIDASVWEADEAYQHYWSDSYLDTYLLVWGETIVEISFWGEEPSPEQIRIVKEKLVDNLP